MSLMQVYLKGSCADCFVSASYTLKTDRLPKKCFDSNSNNWNLEAY